MNSDLPLGGEYCKSNIGSGATFVFFLCFGLHCFGSFFGFRDSSSVPRRFFDEAVPDDAVHGTLVVPGADRRTINLLSSPFLCAALTFVHLLILLFAFHTHQSDRERVKAF